MKLEGMEDLPLIIRLKGLEDLMRSSWLWRLTDSAFGATNACSAVRVGTFTPASTPRLRPLMDQSEASTAGAGPGGDRMALSLIHI